MKHFRDQEAEVFRMAGSHSKADVIAFVWNGHPWMNYTPMLIQCKTGKNLMTKKERKELKEYAEMIGCFSAVAYRERRKLVIDRLD
jgi:hypothetical protein